MEVTIEDQYERCCRDRDSLESMIDSLQEEIRRLRFDLNGAKRELEQIRPVADEQWNSYSTAARLLAERDEARREICNRTSYPDRTPETEAKMRGWDCFPAENAGCKNLIGVVSALKRAVPPRYEIVDE